MFQTKFVNKIETHFMFNNCFPLPCCLWDYVEKYCRLGYATDDNTAHANCMLDN